MILTLNTEPQSENYTVYFQSFWYDIRKFVRSRTYIRVREFPMERLLGLNSYSKDSASFLLCFDRQHFPCTAVGNFEDRKEAGIINNKEGSVSLHCLSRDIQVPSERVFSLYVSPNLPSQDSCTTNNYHNMRHQIASPSSQLTRLSNIPLSLPLAGPFLMTRR